MLKVSNTLTGKKEEFKPIHKGKVGMYNCGPTVYDYAHIGNLRAYVFADVLRRTLEYLNYKVNQVINITDIGHLSSDADSGEDKMTKALKREGKPMTLAAMREVADFYFDKFKLDLRMLHIETPEHFPFASDHIKEDIALIDILIDKGFTYSTSDGVYFDTSKMKDYGKLGGVVPEADERSRIGINPEKKNPRDFAIWKFNDDLGYDAQFGKGFPGWHIECSAMSMKYLGETFDIHTGGIDHIPVHHNNEIAQSESATGKKFVNYWVHSAFVNVPDGKMAKSEENFTRLQTLIDHGIHPLAYRYWLLQANYSSPIQFSLEALEGAETGYRKLKESIPDENASGKINNEYRRIFSENIENDLNTPEALALVWKLIKDDSVSPADKRATLLDFDRVLGLDLKTNEFEIKNIPENIRKLLDEREKARTNKDFVTSDKIRNELKEKGYIIEDRSDGPKISRI